MSAQSVVLIIITGFELLGLAILKDLQPFAKMKCQFDDRCWCHSVLGESLYKADCSELNLTSILSFPNNIRQIDFSSNNIKYIEDDIFSNNDNLLSLDLSRNRLQILSKHSFEGLYHLHTLIINNNRIVEVANDTFRHLKNLQFLNFKKNPFNSLDFDFSYIPSLTTLKVDFTPNNNTVYKHLMGLNNVKHLDVSGFSGNCSVKTLSEETFKHVTQLESINLSACSINFIYKGTFRKMTSLTFLDVSSNRCLKFSGVENITFDLPYTSIEILKINKVHQTNELNTEVRVSHFENLIKTNLSELHIDSNRIQLFEPGALTKLPPTLQVVSAADNEFSPGSYYLDILTLSMHTLNVSFMRSSHDPKLRDESCDTHPRCMQPCNSDNQLDAKSKKHMELYEMETRLPGDIYFLPVPPNLTKIVLQNSKARYEIPPVFITRNKIAHINAGYNILYAWIGPVLGLENLQHLDLSNNFCSNVSTRFFLRFSGLKTLFVQNNLLGFVLPDDVDGEIFKYVPKLELINLSENRITMLPDKFFGSQKSLQKLIISGNMIDNITFHISHMSNLSYLDLSNNRITSLTKQVTKQLEAIVTKNSRLKIDLSGNRLQCTCDTIDFVKWISETNIRVHNLPRTQCQLLHTGARSLAEAKEIYSILKKECSSYMALTIGLVVLLVLFTTVLSLGLIYRNRWKLRYLYYMVKSKHRGTITIPPDMDNKTYEYDAFISYDNQDRHFVLRKLLDNLENNSGLKLCIHSRDFLPGNEIALNITSAIHNSRKTIAIMSHNYLESYWCMFEYNMAKMESIYSRNKENILFLVFLEQIRPKDMPLHIMELVQSQSYIEYPNDPYGDLVFWDRIKKVLTP